MNTSCDISVNEIKLKSVVSDFIYYDDAYILSSNDEDKTCSSLNICTNKCNPTCKYCKNMEYVDDESIASHCSEIKSIESFNSFDELDDELLIKERNRATIINNNRKQLNLRKKLESDDYQYINGFNGF